MSDNPDNAAYRPCAGAMIVDRTGRVFVGQRLDSVVEAWQMPQGGIDPGEDAFDAAVREVREETGIADHQLDHLATAPDELRYDLPPDLAQRIWGGRWRGQRQRWFLFAFTGTDADIDIRTPHPEFRAWRWADRAEVPALIVPFKRALYEAVLTVFDEPLRAHGGSPA